MKTVDEIIQEAIDKTTKEMVDESVKEFEEKEHENNMATLNRWTFELIVVLLFCILFVLVRASS